jgi:hypothetical protein
MRFGISVSETERSFQLDTQTNDEAFILLQSIDLLHKKFAHGPASKPVKRSKGNIK